MQEPNGGSEQDRSNPRPGDPRSEEFKAQRAAANHANAVRYWRANKRLMLVLLAIWAFVSYGLSIFMAPWLNSLPQKVGNLPMGFWWAQQGSIYVFVVLIFIYAFGMDRLDRKYKVEE